MECLLVSITQLINLRSIIGYLGEKENYNWWSSTFFSASSDAFLAPVFNRTQLLAQLTGVSRAASRIHDEFIGVGAVYHLFRLPERIEQRIVTQLQQEPGALAYQSSKTEALAWLQEYVVETAVATTGPVHIGNFQKLEDESSWKTVAAHYLNAFEMGERAYPYFREASE